MTGNTSKWRAPLAGLASIAMLATMGVAASTANAASSVDESGNFTVGVYTTDAPYQFATAANGAVDKFSGYSYGKVFDKLADVANPYTSKTDGKVLTGYSYDKDGKKTVGDAIAVKGDTKLYAQYAKAYTVTFKGTSITNVGTNGSAGTTAADQVIEVAEGQPVSVADYEGDSYGSQWISGAYAGVKEPTAPYGKVFVGWSTSNNKDNVKLYTNGAINADTVLYPVFANLNEDVARVKLTDAQTGDSNDKDNKPLYTFADQAFPEFRADTKYKNAEWQSGKTEPSGTAYDFNQTVENAIRYAGTEDLKLWGVEGATNKAWTVYYHFGKADPTVTKNDGYDSTNGVVKVYTSADGKVAQPSDPAYAGQQFTGWFEKDADTAFDFSKTVESQADAKNGSRTLHLYSGWDTENIVPVAFYYNYNNAEWNNPSGVVTDADGNVVAKAKTGKALDYVTSGTAIQQPAGLEDYFQTAADKDHGTYTSRTVTSWKNVLSGAPITKVTAAVSVYANWAGAKAVLLDANGGKWSDTGADKTRYVTKADGQTWQDVVPTPTRSGYNFVGWTNTQKTLYANLYDGYFYTFANKKTKYAVEDGAELTAQWAAASTQSATSLHNRFGLTGVHKTADVQTVADAGYTDASAKAYVDAWYNLQNEYYAAAALKDQAQVDAYNKLVPKYQAAEQLLVKSNSAEVPAGKVAVYRAFNPNETRGGSHLYTTSEAEYNAVVRAGWKGEGVQFQTTSSKKAEPVYRLYNPNDGSHFYTLSEVEYKHTVKAGWKYEGIGWYVAKDASESVLRIYNPNSGEHVFTLSKAEVNHAVKAGWNDEGVAFKAYAAK
ncbi:InlB B-repeat-containing protein [Bifidobacterium sp. MA2]|uniref:InlB B-repeat-containing protein n=1 Tax=Bifidobacterium santillanense TaxID=2809028 RepID=A0ABS5USS7_9BIFI|nr:InlB B-repeat-containing protein [Bifidobacterium santillanense]MBT1173861.1 InlB B-repeat-containing protein [Bifidobacterium santillanense]